MSIIEFPPKTPGGESFASLLQGIFEGHNFSYLTDNEKNVWFVAKDVCGILNLDDVSKAVKRLDDDEKGTTTIPTLGRNQEVLTISESGLYSLIATSRKPEAKKFKKHVNSVILPQIRQTGSYQEEKKPLTLIDSVKLMLTELEGKEVIIQEKDKQDY